MKTLLPLFRRCYSFYQQLLLLLGIPSNLLANSLNMQSSAKSRKMQAMSSLFSIDCEHFIIKCMQINRLARSDPHACQQ